MLSSGIVRRPSTSARCPATALSPWPGRKRGAPTASQWGSEPGVIPVTVLLSDQYLYVGNTTTVSVVSSTTNQVVATIPGFSNPTGIAVTPNGQFAYVSNDSAATVSVINTATNQIV